MSADCRTKQNLNKKKFHLSPVTCHLNTTLCSFRSNTMTLVLCLKVYVTNMLYHVKKNFSQFLVFHHIGHTYVVPCPYQDQKDRPWPSGTLFLVLVGNQARREVKISCHMINILLTTKIFTDSELSIKWIIRWLMRGAPNPPLWRGKNLFFGG